MAGNALAEYLAGNSTKSRKYIFLVFGKVFIIPGPTFAAIIEICRWKNKLGTRRSLGIAF
jgi:hypothetical protein